MNELGSTSSDYGVSLRTAKLTALFCALISGVYGAVQVTPSPVLGLCLSFAPLLAVVFWVQADAKRTRVGSGLDSGFFLWFAWPIAVPWYVFKTRGRSGWRLVLGLLCLISSGYLSWFVIAWGLYGIRYAMWYLRIGT